MRLEADAYQAGGFVIAKGILDSVAPIGVAEFGDNGDAADAEADTGGERGAHSDFRPEIIPKRIGTRIAVGSDYGLIDVVMGGGESKRPSGTDEGLPRSAARSEIVFA